MSRFDTIADQYADPGAYKPRKLYNMVFKRLIDLLFALVLLPFLSPVLAVIAIFVKLDSPGPVFLLWNSHGLTWRQAKHNIW